MTRSMHCPMRSPSSPAAQNSGSASHDHALYLHWRICYASTRGSHMDLVWGLSAAIALYAAAHVPKLAGERRARLAVLWEKTLTDAEHPPSRGARASYLW